MKRKPPYNRFRFSNVLVFFGLMAAIIQFAVLVYDAIEEKARDNTQIALSMLAVIIVLAAVCTVIDVLRRRVMIDRPLRKILDATDRIASGDFSVRLTPDHPYHKYSSYDLIMENLNTMAAELGKSEVLKNDFISNVSHELKTPLAVIQNYVTLLQDDSLDEESRARYAKTLQEAAKRFSDLITNILKLNKLENQKIRPEEAHFSLSDALAEAVFSFEDTIERKNITLTCDFEEVSVRSSRSLLETVWNNLLMNAVKFTEAGGSITVTLKKEGDTAVVSVADTGCGISPETGAHIFEKFYQGDTSHSSEGNGLGLALVKKVIDILGGSISVQSEEGRGSVFTVKLRGAIDER